MAKELAISSSDLISSIKSYNAACNKIKKDPFGKSIFPISFDVNGNRIFLHWNALTRFTLDIIHVMQVTPVIHYTMGGVRFNVEGQVLDKDGKVIPNLYAAGEVTGGLHGKNRLAGNSLLECIIYGRRSAIHATR